MYPKTQNLKMATDRCIIYVMQTCVVQTNSEKSPYIYNYRKHSGVENLLDNL